MLQPLVELQYRGTVWRQRNGRDWTVEAFLASDDALGLDMARDAATRDAALRALPLLAAEPVAALRGRRLEVENFDRLSISDPIRDLLAWMSETAAFEADCAPEHWAAFRDVCAREFAFDPEEDGLRAAADALATGGGKWNEAWRRFGDAPLLYPGIPAVLRTARPKDLLHPIEPPRLPDLNEEREDRLRTALEAAAGLPHADACDKIAALDDEHRERRDWVWVQFDESPYTLALAPLGRLAREAKRDLVAASADALIADYAGRGWRCDWAAVEALSRLKPGTEHALVAKVVRALYEPWLDRAARRFQKLLSAGDMDPGRLASGVDSEPGTCILFADGLRFDLGAMLRKQLEACGVRVRLGHRMAPFPTVTATAKPLASPAHSACVGAASAEDFYPAVSADGKPATAARLRDLMARRGVAISDAGEMPMALDGGAVMYQIMCQLGVLPVVSQNHGKEHPDATDCDDRELTGGFRGRQGDADRGNVTNYVSEGTDSLLFVFVQEDSEQDAVHRGAVLESAQCSSPDLPSFDSVGGPDLSALIGVLEAGQQVVEIVAQACDGLGVCIFPACGEAVGGAPSLEAVVGGSVEILPDGVLLRTLSRTHLVRPAALDRDAVVRGGQGRQQALAAVDADHLQAFAGQAASVEVVRSHSAALSALARR